MKNEYHFYHDEHEGYVLVNLENREILMSIPMSETYDVETNRSLRNDVKEYLKKNNASVVVDDGLDQSIIKFENGYPVGGYSQYDGHDQEALELWGFNLVQWRKN